MRMLHDEEREMLLAQHCDPDPQRRDATTEEQAIARGLIQNDRCRFAWTVNPGGVEHLLLEPTEWGNRALRIDALIRGLT